MLDGFDALHKKQASEIVNVVKQVLPFEANNVCLISDNFAAFRQTLPVLLQGALHLQRCIKTGMLNIDLTVPANLKSGFLAAQQIVSCDMDYAKTVGIAVDPDDEDKVKKLYQGLQTGLSWIAEDMHS